MKKIFALALAAVVSAGAAGAATIQLNVGKGWTQGENTYSNGTHAVKVSGWQYNGFTNTLTSDHSWTASWSGTHGGVGICKYKTASWCNYDQHTVDGWNGNDIAVIDFGGKVVKLTSITFSYADYNDKFDVLAFGNGANVGSTATDYEWDIKTGSGGVSTVALSGLDTGSVFGIGAFHGHSEFKIQAIHYSVIPLPAAGWLLLAGVGGLAALKRRKKE